MTVNSLLTLLWRKVAFAELKHLTYFSPAFEQGEWVNIALHRFCTIAISWQKEVRYRAYVLLLNARARVIQAFTKNDVLCVVITHVNMSKRNPLVWSSRYHNEQIAHMPFHVSGFRMRLPHPFFRIRCPANACSIIWTQYRCFLLYYSRTRRRFKYTILVIPSCPNSSSIISSR